jgi:WD40 repeat protein/tRNA A-37 threonylcarbamoyl transferase component Bud32
MCPQDDATLPGASPVQASDSEIIARLRARPRIEDRYEAEREIARGGMGAILRVHDRDLRRELAMKVILEDLGGADPTSSDAQRIRARFLEEAQVTGQLDHPGIVPVHELGLDARGRLYFTMKLVRGRDLRAVYDALRKNEEGWNLPRVLGVLLRVCEAMAFAHEKGVIHRDLKPANVMVGRFGEVYVMDWGLARVMGSQTNHDRAHTSAERHVESERRETARSGDSSLATLDGDIVGTPAYMSPEQALGRHDEVGARSDVYSLGAMLYELLAGHAPYMPAGEQRTPFTVVRLLTQGPPEPIERLAKGAPEELVSICEKAMARESGARYAGMLELAEDLRAYLEGRVVRAHSTGAVVEFKKWIGRNRGFAAAVATAITVALGLSAALLIMQTRSNRQLEIEKNIADANAREATEARQRTEEANLKLDEEKRVAQANAEEARRKGYAANIAAAAAALEDRDLGRVRSRLRECPKELRGWEWNFLNQLLDQSAALIAPRTFEGEVAPAPLDSVLALACDAEEKVLLAATSGSAKAPSILRAYALDGYRPLGDVDLGGARITALASAPDRSNVAVALSTGEVRVLSLPAREELRRWRLTTPANAMAYQLDGRALLVASEDSLRLVDLASGEERGRWSDLHDTPSCVAVAPDGRRAAYGTLNGFVGLLDFPTREIIWLGERDAPIRSLAFSPDSLRIAAASGHAARSGELHRWQDCVREWDTNSRGLLRLLREDAGEISWCGYDTSGRTLLSVSRGGSIRARDLAVEQETRITAGLVDLVAALPLRGGDTLVTGSEKGTLRLWDTTIGDSLALTGGRVGASQLVFIPGSNRLLSLESGQVRVWDPRTGELEIVLARMQQVAGKIVEAPACIAVDRSGSRIAVGWVTSILEDGKPRSKVRVRDPKDGALLREVLFTATGRPSSVTFHPDGTRVAIGTDAGELLSFEVESGRLSELRGEVRGRVGELVWLDDGRRIAAGTNNGQLALWDTQDGTRTLVFDRADTYVYALQRSVDGSALWIDAGSKMIRLDLASLAMTEQPASADSDGRITWIDGDRRLLCRTRSGRVGILDATSATLLLSLPSPEQATAIAASADGSMVASGFASGAIRVWSREGVMERSLAREASQNERALALDYVGNLFETEALRCESVLARLQVDATLAPERRAAALRLAYAVNAQSRALASACEETVLVPRLDRIDYRVALWQALELGREDPSSATAALYEGAARYRLASAEPELLRGALAALERARGLIKDETFERRLELSALETMVLAKLGEFERAATALRALLGEFYEAPKLSGPLDLRRVSELGPPHAETSAADQRLLQEAAAVLQAARER